jgi:putative thiamine transport system ATP-binding protein
MNSLALTDVEIRARKTNKLLFRRLSLLVPAGTVTTVMGPSGIGKSTLIEFIGGHLDTGFIAEGRIELNGRDLTELPAESRKIGILFQDALLFPHLSVGDNLAFGLSNRFRGRTARRKAVDDALDQAGLGGTHDRDPATLSGGQRARAALMRTLLAEPRALLLDEPFSKLDPELRADIRGFVFSHIRKQAIPVLLVSHDASDAEAAGGQIIQL